MSAETPARPLASPPREFKPQAYQCGSVDQYENKLRETQAELAAARGELEKHLFEDIESLWVRGE